MTEQTNVQPSASSGNAPPSRLKRALRRLNGLFVVTVAIPTLIAVLYYGLVASEVYISESRFVVRSPQRPAQSGLGALLQGTGFSRSQDDTYSVHDFIRSRDALRDLDSKIGVRRSYADPAVDPINRFPGLAWWDTSFEALYRFYLDRVTITYDSVSSISILTVRAYTADDAQRVNQALLEMGERLVNNMNTRSRQDLIQVAEQEVRVAEERSKVAAAALSAFRADRAVFDPDRQSALQLQAVARLREELLAAESQLDQVRRVAPGNPQLGTLEARVAALRKAIGDENTRMLGRDGGLSSKSPVYDRLVLERTFADRQLGAALVALDTARSEAVRKQLYLERLVEPNRPDRALEPRRIRSIATVFVLGLICWAVASLIIVSIKEHTE